MRADRLVSLVLLLQTRGKMTAQALAEELEVSRRTILRDIDALSFAGVPIYAEGGHGGGIALDENYRTTLTGLQESEILTLMISGNTQNLQDVGLANAAETSVLKLLASLPQAHQPSVEHMRQRILIDPDWWWHETQPMPHWEKLQRAVYEDWCIQITYKNYRDEIVQRILEPYSLVTKSSFWYLVARREGEFRTYRVTRILDLEIIDQHFTRLPEFDLPTHWRRYLQEFGQNFRLYEFTIHLAPQHLGFIRQVAAGRHQVLDETTAEGWLVIKLKLDSLDFARMLVVGLGQDVWVAEPLELREAIVQTARDVLRKNT